MATETVYVLGESSITVSGGEELSGQSQGSGVHLLGQTITLNANAWEAVLVDDSEANFDDSDNSQTLDGDQTFDGTSYSDGSRVEAEFTIEVQDPDGNTYTLVAFNINEGGGASYATVEGLAFVGGVGGFPPIGVELTVISNQEGPSIAYSDLASPPCFTAGSMIETDLGEVAVESLRSGDLVKTRDHGFQRVVKVMQTCLPQAVLAQCQEFRPILIKADAFGAGHPVRATRLSPQHRVLVTGWRAELYCAQDEVLVPVVKMVNDHSICVDHAIEDVTYVHVLLQGHEILTVDGLASESLLPGMMGAAGEAEVAQLFGADLEQGRLDTVRMVAQGAVCTLLAESVAVGTV